MVSDAELAELLVAILQKSDFSTTTASTIRQRLESELGIDLSSKKGFVRKQIDLYLLQQQRSYEQNEAKDYISEEEGEGEGEVEGEVEGDFPEGVEVEDKEGVEREEVTEEDGKSLNLGTRSSQVQPESKRLKAKIDRAVKKSLPKEKKRRAGGAGGLNKVCGLSPELQLIIGQSQLPRTQVVKQLWQYIKTKNLQDPENKQKIICNEALRGLFGTDSTDMFKMNKLLSKHIWPLDNNGPEGGGGETPKAKKAKKESSGGKGKNSGLLSPQPISEKLASFLGTGETKVPRADVVRRMWAYIKKNELQDPANARNILCDEKLEELFGCKTFVGFGMAKLLQPHFIKE